MKAFVASVVALAASTGASPAADPQLLVNGLGYTSGVAVGVVPEVALKDTGMVHHAGSGAITPDFTDAQKAANPEIAEKATQIKKYALTGNAKVVAGVNPVVGVNPLVGYGYGLPAAHQVLYGKREADDRALFYTAGVVPAVHPVVSTSGLVAHPDGAVTPDYTPAQKVAAAQHFAAKGAYALRPLNPVYHYGKRDADAEAKPYWGYGGYGLPTYGYPTVYHYGKRDADAEAKPYWGYGGYGLPAATLGYGYPSVYHTYGKREAEAEAKPYWGYGGYGLGLPATTYGYPSVYHTYGKRDADAEAKPYWGYGGYGLGLPATTYGYPSVYHTYGKREAEAEAKPYFYGGYGLPAYGGYAYPGYYY